MVFLLPISNHIYIQITLFTQFMYLYDTNSKYGKSHGNTYGIDTEP